MKPEGYAETKPQPIPGKGSSMNKITVTTIDQGTLKESDVSIDGDAIEIDNGHLSIYNEDGDVIALFASGRWARATMEEK
jgi:hypothetical protein